MSTFSERLKKLRTGKKLTQEELARAADLSIDAIRKLEQTPDANPRMNTIIALAKALDVDAGKLIGGKS